MEKTNIITVLCEGPHDIAFLSKVLKADNFKSNEKKKIGEYPIPYNHLLQTEAKKSNINNLNIQELKNVLLPSATLVKNNNHLFLYSLGGDSRKDKRQELLHQLDNFIAKSEDEFDILPKNTSLSILYFFDADEKGVKKRMEDVNQEIKEVFSEFENIQNSTEIITLFAKIKFGVYIFKKENIDSGKLEDIILPIMKKGNDAIFNEAEKYISTHLDKKRVKGNNFNIDKSIICVAGQLQKSGSSNVVCIGQSDYLNKKDILEDTLCKEIIQFFNTFCV